MPMHRSVATLIQLGVVVASLFAYTHPKDVLALAAPAPQWATDDRAQVIKFASLNLVLFAVVRPTRFRAVIMVLVALQSVFWTVLMVGEKSLRLVWPQLTEKKETAWLRVIANLLSLIMVGVVTVGSFGGDESPHRKKLVAFYTKADPSKIAVVDRVLERFQGREEEMFTQLRHKYSRVLSHTPEEQAADEFDDEDTVAAQDEHAQHQEEDADDEREQETSESMPEESEAAVEDDDKDEEEEHAQPSKQGKSKQPVAPLFPTPAPMPTTPVLRTRLNFDSTTATPSPPKASASIYKRRRTSAAIRAAIDDARRAQASRVTERVSQLHMKETTKDE